MFSYLKYINKLPSCGVWYIVSGYKTWYSYVALCWLCHFRLAISAAIIVSAGIYVSFIVSCLLLSSRACLPIFCYLVLLCAWFSGQIVYELLFAAANLNKCDTIIITVLRLATIFRYSRQWHLYWQNNRALKLDVTKRCYMNTCWSRKQCWRKSLLMLVHWEC